MEMKKAITDNKISKKPLESIKLPKPLIDLIINLLSLDKKKRPTHEEIISNNIFLNLENFEIQFDDNLRNQRLDQLILTCSVVELQRQVQEYFSNF